MYFWLYISKNSYGPYTKKSVLGFLDRGVINDRALAWRRGRQGWTKLQDLLPQENSTSEVRYLQVCRQGSTYGPYSVSAVSKYLDEGALYPKDLVWHHDIKNWKTLGEFSSYFSFPDLGVHPIAKIPFRLWITRNGKIWGPYCPSKVADWVEEKKLFLKKDYAYPSDHRIWIKLDGVRQVGLRLFNRGQNRTIREHSGIEKEALPKSGPWYVIDSGFKETSKSRK